MTTAFGPDGENWTTLRPPHEAPDSGGADTWFKDCTSPSARDGTQLTAANLNMIVGNLREAVRSRNVALEEGDVTLLANAMATLRDVVDADVTYTIDPNGGGDFLTLQEAGDFLRDKMIPRSVTVTLAPVAGDHVMDFDAGGGAVFDHPYGHRIVIEGPTLTGAWPTADDVDDDSPSVVETFLRQRFPARIIVDGATAGLYITRGAIRNLRRVLVIGDGTLNQRGIFAGEDFQNNPGKGDIGLDDVWFHGLGSDGVRARRGSVVFCTRVGATHCGEYGFRLEDMAHLFVQTSIVASHCGVHGIGTTSQAYFGLDTSATAETNKNVGAGLAILNGGWAMARNAASVTANANGASNIVAQGARVDLPSTVTTASPDTGSDLLANNGGYIMIPSGAASGKSASPTVNTVGNHQSYIRSY